METPKVLISSEFLTEGIIIDGDRYELRKIEKVETFPDRLNSLIRKLDENCKLVVAIVLTPTDFLVLHSKYYREKYPYKSGEAAYMGNILIESSNAESSYIITSEAKIWRI